MVTNVSIGSTVGLVPGNRQYDVSQTMAEKFADQQRLAASFFFSRRAIERRITHHFFPTIVTQFLSSIPTIFPFILAAQNGTA